MAYIDDPATQRANLGFIKASMRAPLLSRAREFVLARRWREKGDTAALHELVRAYTRLVVATASRFRSYGLPMGDLVQEGNVGLMQAAARFEPERGVRFSTYAAWWIRSAMQDYVLRNWSIVRTGTTAASKPPSAVCCAPACFSPPLSFSSGQSFISCAMAARVASSNRSCGTPLIP
jgi:RNA polymerase sigma-32 factor